VVEVSPPGAILDLTHCESSYIWGACSRQRCAVGVGINLLNRDLRVSIDRPRRIFRGSSRVSSRRLGRAGVSRALYAGLLGAAGGAALVLVGLSTDLFGRVPPGPSEISAAADQVIVIDGDTLRLGEIVVRLGDLVAPARGEACAAGPDCGARAAAALASLVQDRWVGCQIVRHDPGGRVVARCQAGGRDLNAALVEIGWARSNAPELEAVQSDARAHRRGIWFAG
jgi:endonuclease YncB( thermonuclease family)